MARDDVAMSVPESKAVSPPEGARRTLADYLDLIRRRRGVTGWTFFVAVVATVATAVLWPPTWRSTGVILIEQQEIPTELVRAPVTSYADQRVQVISQHVMTTGNLLSIIDKFGLYTRLRQDRPREVVLQRMRNDIAIRMISADVVDPRQGRSTKATIAFSVSYDGDTPEQAANVANEITSLYLRENLETRQKLAAQSANFLQDESDRIRERVTALGQEIATFKSAHGEALPEYAQMNLQLVERVNEEMRDVDTRALALDQQILFLDSQLAQIAPDAQMYSDGGQRVLSAGDRLKMLRTQFAAAKAVYGPTHPDVVRLQQQIVGLEGAGRTADSRADLRRQLADAQTQLAAARERYSPSHPDVQRLERIVAATQNELGASTEASADAAPSPDNPVYIQLQTQRESAANERQALLARKAVLNSRNRELERRLAQTPGIEKDYSSLLRDLQVEQAKYAELRQKQMEAQLASNLESESKGERFSLIEPPSEPQKPARPDRPLIFLLGLLMAAAAAFGAMLTVESLDTRVRGRGDVLALLQVPPLAIVPWVQTEAELRVRRRTLRIAAAGAAGCLVVTALLVHTFYRPLDLLWLATLRRLG
jgi:uncharacterized protein involved in exopolysaccharide biosynthesis